LPDGTFSNQKIPIWENFEGPGKENIGTFYAPLEYITAMWYILCPFGNLVAIWHIFPRFGILYREKSGNPDSDESKRFNTNLLV
jgi:hypothetical protein